MLSFLSHNAVLISISIALSETPAEIQDHKCGINPSYGVPVFLPPFTSTELYFLVTEAVTVPMVIL